MKSSSIMFALFVVGLALPRLAIAHGSTVEPTRFAQVTCSGASYNVHWNHTSVPVYLNASTAYGVQYLISPNGSQWGLADSEAMLHIVLNELNDSLGENLRLYYAGTTASVTVSGAIVISASVVGSDKDGYAELDPTCVSGFKGRILAARVRFNRFTQSGAARQFSAFAPGEYTSAVDWVSLGNHEIGHALGLMHSDKASPPGVGATLRHPLI